MEYRSLSDLGADVELRGDGDGRTLAGIIVPWNRPTRINATLEEEFIPGAFGKQTRDPGRIHLARGHVPLGGSLIGKVTMLRNDAAGLYAEARVTPTVMGEETLALLRDGVLEQWSIGFREVQNRRTAKGIVQRVKAHLSELAIVPQGAYGELAMVGSMRHLEPTPLRDEAAAVLAGFTILPPMPRTRS